MRRLSPLLSFGLAFWVAVPAGANAAERAAPRQRVLTQTVPDQAGRPWEMTIRPIATLADAEGIEDAGREIETKTIDVAPAGLPSASRNSALAASPPAEPGASDKAAALVDTDGPAETQPPASPKLRTALDQSPALPVERQPVAAPKSQTEPLSESMAPVSDPGKGLMTITPAAGTANVGSAYRQTYRAIPYNPRLAAERPGYRHELTVLLLTGETLPPISQATPADRGPAFADPASPYRPYIPAQWDYYQAYPPVFRTLNPYGFLPGGFPGGGYGFGF